MDPGEEYPGTDVSGIEERPDKELEGEKQLQGVAPCFICIVILFTHW